MRTFSKQWFLFLFIFSYNFCNAQSDASTGNQQNYYYDTLSVLTGTLKVESYYGPPGYGESPETDTKENSYILILDHPVNVLQNNQDAAKIDYNTTKMNNDKIQLTSALNLHPFIDKKIKVTGTFFGEHTGHHHTPVLFTVKNIEEQQ